MATLFLLHSFLFFLASQTFVSSETTVSIHPKTISRHQSTVRITWSGIKSPSELDWLGIYSPPNSADKNFIGYIYLNASKSWKDGYGFVDIPLVNLRSNYQFRFFKWYKEEIDYSHKDHDNNPLPGHRHRIAVSEELEFTESGPSQIHLSFTDKIDEMRVLFITRDGKQSFVKYGEKRESLDMTEETKVETYSKNDMCDKPANSSYGWRHPGFIHDGLMKSLKKGRKYYYMVGSNLGGWSDVHSFISRDDNSNETIAFLFGDMGTTVPYKTFRRVQKESALTVKWILRDLETIGDRASFVSHIGDISYARGYSWLWDSFFTLIEPIASKIPYHVCIGNHEYDWPTQPWKPDWAMSIYGRDGGGECGVPYSLKFHMPGNSYLPTRTGAPDTRNLYYSFDAGVVHFLYMSTETNFLVGSDQYNFIKQDLASVNRTKTPFVIVQGHRPMYTTSDEGRDRALRSKMLEHLEPLFVKNNVTLALWGHVHRYERFCPLTNYSCGGTTVHAVIGMGGQDWQPIWQPRYNHPNDPIFPQPERSMYRGGQFGYTRLEATRQKLTLIYIGNHDGEPHDRLEILSGLPDTTNDHNTSMSRIENKESIETKTVESSYQWSYLQMSWVLLFGVCLGYAVGYSFHYKKKDDEKKISWIPVKTDDVS